jgi:antitoxin ParD1/3/4
LGIGWVYLGGEWWESSEPTTHPGILTPQKLALLPIFGNFVKRYQMKNTSISLGSYFDQFVSSQVAAGRYKNVSEVIRAGLRLLEDEESKSQALRDAIQKGLDSPRIENFNFDDNLQILKKSKMKNG